MANEISSVKNALSVLVVALVIALYLFANSTFLRRRQLSGQALTTLVLISLRYF